MNLASVTKRLVHLTVISALVAPTAAYPAVPKAQKPPLHPGAIDAKASFRKMKEDPFLSQTYMNALKAQLRSAPDQNMAGFHANDPMAQDPEILIQVDQAMEEGIQEAVISGQTSMHRITSATYPWLMNIIQEIAREYGYTEAQISRIEAFQMDDMNASMSSASVDHPVIYIGKPLADAMRTQMTNGGFNSHRGIDELRGVIGHEFGHNIDQHVLLGFQNVAKVIQLGGIFAKDASFDNLDFRHLENIEELGGLSPRTHAFWKNIVDRYAMLDANSFAPVSNPIVQRVQRKMLGRYLEASRAKAKMAGPLPTKKMMQAFSALNSTASTHPEMASASLKGFLATAIESLEMMPVPYETIDYLKELLRKLELAEKTGRDPIPEDTNIFMGHMEKLLANLSQAMESSADAGGLTQANPKGMAVAFLRFMTAQLDPVLAGFHDENNQPTISEEEFLEMILKEKQTEWANLLSKSDNVVREALGGNSKNDHPVPLKRIIDFFINGRKTATIGFRNDFLKHVILYDTLIDQAKRADREIQAIPQLLAAFKAKHRLSEQQIAELEADAKNQMALKEKFRNLSLKKSKLLSALVVDMISDPTLPKLDGRNPRLMDFIDHQLSRRQDEMAMFETLRQRAKTKNAKIETEAYIAANTTSFETPLVKKLSSILEAELKKPGVNRDQLAGRLTDLDVLVAPAAGIDDVVASLVDLEKDGNFTNRQTRPRVMIEEIKPRESLASCLNPIRKISK